MVTAVLQVKFMLSDKLLNTENGLGSSELLGTHCLLLRGGVKTVKS